MDNQYTMCDLISELKKRKEKKRILERVREICSSVSPSHLQAWILSDGYNLLRCAVKNKHPDVVKLLLAYGSKVNSNNKNLNSPLHYAAGNGNKEIVELLLDRGAKIETKNRFDKTPLHRAVETNKVKIVKLLLSGGADVDAKTNNDKTALHIAAERGYLEIVEHLLNHGANINSEQHTFSPCAHCYTPLHYAVKGGHTKIINLFLSRGVNINTKGADGATALHIAAEKGIYIEIVMHLLNHGANINSAYTCACRGGYTPLHVAANNHHIEIVALLLSRGASIDAKGEDGKTALHIAIERGHVEIIEHLLNHEADIDSTFTSYLRKDSRTINVQTAIVHGTLKCHLVKMRTANLYVSKENLLFISEYTNETISDFQNKCEKEIEKMKSEKVNNTNVSIYDILTKDINHLAMYAGNENIIQVLRSNEYKIKFPMYADMINNHFRKGEKRKELLEQSHKIFHFFFINFGLPEECTEKIFSYLSNEDLRILKDPS